MFRAAWLFSFRSAEAERAVEVALPAAVVMVAAELPEVAAALLAVAAGAEGQRGLVLVALAPEAARAEAQPRP